MNKMLICMVLAAGIIIPAWAQKPGLPKLEDIDKNFQSAKVGNLEINYFNALKPPFKLSGFPWQHPTEVFYRLPDALTEKEVNKGALIMARHTAGGAIRFRTDSLHIVLRAVLAYSSDMNHMPRAGSSGFDLYNGTGTNIRYVKTAQPNANQQTLELLMVGNSDGGMKDWTLYLPLYGSASKIEIGLKPGAIVEEPTPHTVKDPILFYGSSITQGGCASRPGNAYTTMLCRAVDAPQINLGFSGSARGEIAVAQAIAGLKLSVFIMDYDHNAPTTEHLEKTHEPFFKAIRGKKPDLPIIIISRCNFRTQKDAQRREIIRRTYDNAVKNGDKKVWFIDGETLFGNEDSDACTVDGCHPNDLGFYRMYRRVLPVLQQALNLK